MGSRSLAKLLQKPPQRRPSSLRRRSEAGRLGALSRGNLQRHRAGRDRAAPPPPFTPWTGKVARDSRSVAVDAGEQPLVSACPASSAADWPEPGRPVAPRSPEGMRQPPNTRLPGSAARASESCECGARRGMGVLGRDFFGGSLISCPLQTPGTELYSPMRGVPCPCPPRAKINADAKARLHRLWLRAGGQGAGTPSSTTLRFAGALLSKLRGVCLVMGNEFSPGVLGGDIFHLAVSLVWCSDCW